MAQVNEGQEAGDVSTSVVASGDDLGNFASAIEISFLAPTEAHNCRTPAVSYRSRIE